MGLASCRTVRQYGQSMLPDRSTLTSSSDRPRAGGRALRNLVATLSLCGPFLIFAQALTSCGDDDSKLCNAGDLRPCPCAGDEMSTQQCNAQGSGYGECNCGNSGGTGGTNMSGGGSSGTSNAGSAGSAGATVTDRIPLGVGAPCRADIDCPVEEGTQEALLTCLLSTSNADFEGGGPQGGYCTLPCDSSADCREVDTASSCGEINRETGASYCIALCQPGNSQ